MDELPAISADGLHMYRVRFGFLNHVRDLFVHVDIMGVHKNGGKGAENMEAVDAGTHISGDLGKATVHLLHWLTTIFTSFTME